MRHKLERYHRDIRRQEHEALFKMRREQMLREEEAEAEIVGRSGRSLREESQMHGENDEYQHSQADIYQQWRVDQAAIRKHSEERAFASVLNIVRSVYDTLREVRTPGRLLNFRKAQIHQTLLRSGMLSQIIRATMKTQRDECTSGILQKLAVKSLSILKHLVSEQPADFSEQLFLQSDILPFLRLCANQAPYDKNHISRLISLAVHMLHTSSESSGQLLRLMFAPGAVFGVGVIIYCISRNQLEPNEQVTINFLIFMKTCVQKAEEASDRSLQTKNQVLDLLPFLTAAESDLVFELALRSAHYFLHNLQEQDANLSLQQSLEVVKHLAEQSDRYNKWLKRIDLKGFVNLLRERQCPIDISQKIMLIVDHLIFLDNSQSGFSFELVRGCELLPIIWAIKDRHFVLVSNIICNLATMEEFHQDMAPYLHHYFLAFRYDKGAFLLLQLLYNWLYAKHFDLSSSQDKLILIFLQDYTIREKISDRDSKKAQVLQSLLWLSLASANEISVPRHVLEYNNPSSQQLRNLLDGHQDLGQSAI